MKYYTSTTEYNCGIDLHARQMYVCVMDRQGKKLVHCNVQPNDFDYFLKLIKPYRHDLTVCCECMFGWYWLAAIRQPLQIESLSLTNGRFRYCERLAVGADPAVLTFGAVSLSAEGIANRGEPTAAIHLRGQGDLMDAATMKVRMSIPITPSEFSLHYSGSLSAMDLTRLDAFLDIAEHTRITSGSAQEAAFEINVTAGQARGWVRGIYRDLEIAVLDNQTGTAEGLDNRVLSFLANLLTIRNANAPDASGAMKEREVNYTRRADEPFQEFAWFALRTGILDIISH